MRLSGKVMVITGATSQIGLATAILCSNEGARLVLGDVNEPAGDEAVELIRRNGGEAAFVRTDVSSSADVDHLVGSAVERYGRLDIMFNNAGVAMGGRSQSAPTRTLITWSA